MLLSFRKNRWDFKCEEFRDSGLDCVNPGRGWYRLFEMDASLSVPVKRWKWCQAKEEQLALLLVDIGAYADDEIAYSAIRHIRQALGFFRDEEKELLLRFEYGGAVSDSRIRQHKEQIAPLLEEFKDNILCLQGFFDKGGSEVDYGADVCGEIEKVVAHFRNMRISYLSSVHYPKVIEHWKNSSYRGENAYDYIGRHLGYRFLVKSAILVGRGKNQTMEVVLENSGFAPLYTNCRPILYSVRGKNVSMLSSAKEDLKTLMPGENLRLRFDLTDAAPGEVALCIRQRRTGRFIRTANEGAGDYCRIGVLEACV